MIEPWLGVVFAAFGVGLGIVLSRLIRRKRVAAEQRRRDAAPQTFASRQDMRRAERAQRKKEAGRRSPSAR